MNTVDRFWAKVSKPAVLVGRLHDETDSCWNWTGGLLGKGYGQFWSGTKRVLAHRFSWELHNGPIPEGMLVCHSCDNAKCMNPDHLFIGSYSDNMRDCVKKGRYTSPVKRGEAHGSAKLTEADVRAIRARPRSTTHASLARKYGVALQTIWSVRKREHWTHI